MTPGPRKCGTPGCTAGPCEPRRDPVGIDQTHQSRPAWIFECPCGWRMTLPTREPMPGELTPGQHLDEVTARIFDAEPANEPAIRPTLDLDREGVVVGVEIKF